VQYNILQIRNSHAALAAEIPNFLRLLTRKILLLTGLNNY